MNYALTILVVIANLLGAGMIVPQVLWLKRSGSAEGVSAVGVGVGVVQNLWWSLYAVQADGALGILPVSIAGVLLYGTIGLQLVGIVGRRSLRPIVGGFVGIGIVPLIPYLLADLETAGLIIGFLYGLQFAPAAVTAMRTREPDGVSAATWWMALAEAAIWFIYGLNIGDAALTLGGAGGSFMAGVIVVRLTITRPRSRVRLAA